MDFRLSLTLIAAPLLCSGAAVAHEAQRPNIVYIMSDDHAYQAISACGSAVSKLAPTPNIDPIAKNGAIFTNSFVGNSLCGPSRARCRRRAMRPQCSANGTSTPGNFTT